MLEFFLSLVVSYMLYLFVLQVVWPPSMQQSLPIFAIGVPPLSLVRYRQDCELCFLVCQGCCNIVGSCFCVPFAMCSRSLIASRLSHRWSCLPILCRHCR
jgi:hypothetical protein